VPKKGKRERKTGNKKTYQHKKLTTMNFYSVCLEDTNIFS
jgi:hypothetical protein